MIREMSHGCLFIELVEILLDILTMVDTDPSQTWMVIIDASERVPGDIVIGQIEPDDASRLLSIIRNVEHMLLDQSLAPETAPGRTRDLAPRSARWEKGRIPNDVALVERRHALEWRTEENAILNAGHTPMFCNPSIISSCSRCAKVFHLSL